MMRRYRVAVLGGGIVGCSCLYSLARRGWTDTILLERLDLTHGSTWHAAGNVTHFGHYSSITQLYVDSLKLYQAAEAESAYPIGFHRTGSLRLAVKPGEMSAYSALAPIYETLDVPFRMIEPDEIRQLHPLLDLNGVEGAAYTPADGHVDPTSTTTALAKAAQARGAHVQRRCPALAIKHAGSGGWEIETADGVVVADHIIVATSFWAREMLQDIGLSIPVHALEHHEIITDTVQGLSGASKVPTVRDPYSASNVRREGDGFLIGVYEETPKPWSVDAIPKDFGPELLSPDLERLEDKLSLVMERFPAIANAGIKTVNNGPICYSPDGCPIIGPVDGFPGLWLATGFSIGIGTGGGSAEFLSAWMVDGTAPYDLPIVSPDRFGSQTTAKEDVAKIVATYAKGYG